MASLKDIRVSRKVAALGWLSVVAAVTLAVMLVRQNWGEVRAAHTEAAGLAPAADMLRWIQVTQEHRGLAAAELGGDTSAKAKRQAKQGEVDQAAQKALASTTALGGSAIQGSQNSLGADWQQLAQAVAAGSLPGPESFARHSSLVQRQQLLLDEVVASSGLALDPEAHTYFLIQGVLSALPQLTESLGRLRGRGTALLARGQLEPQDRAWLALTLEQAQLRFAHASAEMSRAAQASAVDAKALQASSGKAQTAFHEAARLVQEQLLTPEMGKVQSSAFFAKMTEAIDAQYGLMHAGFAQLKTNLEVRAASAQRWAFLQAALGALMCLVSLMLMWSMSRSIARNSAQAITAAQTLSQGDFSQPIQADSADEFGQIVAAMETVRVNMARAVGEVRLSVDSVATASQQIAQGNMDLSHRTELQASSLQQTASSMEELTGTVSQSTDSAQQANQLAAAASEAATRGGDVVGQVVSTMQDIATSSKRIAEIIGVIDGIAFQTNILALNAAVEAARAGEQGRGFAVVATEVRNLAQRSAQAAKEIKVMISSSVEKVEAGTRLADDAGTSITDIVNQVRRVTDLIGEISAASREQSSGLGLVNQSVAQMDQMTQQNAALVEESAAAAASLSEQAERLAQAVSVFRLAGSEA